MTTTVPSVMVDFVGDRWGITKGVAADPAAVAAHVSDPADGPLLTDVLHAVYVPRIKWCENRGGCCELNGEWHSHWEPVVPSPGSEWTIARYGEARR